MKQKLYKHLARKMDAYIRCMETPDNDFTNKHKESIETLVYQYMPSGSGIDAGINFDFTNSTANKLVLTFSYHHMDESGYYDGWTEHKLIVTPSLAFGFDMKITGRDKNATKDYLYQTFDYALRLEVEAQIKALLPKIHIKLIIINYNKTKEIKHHD